MDQQHQYVIGLLKKHLQGTLTTGESQALMDWAESRPENRELLNRISREDSLLGDMSDYWQLWNDTEKTEREERIFRNASERANIPGQEPTKTRAPHRRGRIRGPILRRMKWLPYAAVATLLIIGLGILITDNPTDATNEIAITDIPPGGNRAMLTLADGRTIELSTEQAGIVIGDDITYADGTMLLSDQPAGNKATEALVLTTPRGGTYRVTLPDGSEVWLNANSTLRYPARFSETERLVELEGEAYFQVKEQPDPVPFRVATAAQTIEVLGTEFNVNAYPEETGTKTTLVSGSVEVINHDDQSRNRIIPGEQFTSDGNSGEITKVNIAHFTAWKDGRFSFDGKSFEQIMREMARWYDIEIQYEGDVPTDRFMGDAYRTDRLSTVLHFLESSNVSYRLEQERGNGAPRLIIQYTNKKEENN